MCKVCLALQVLLLACWTLNDSLLGAQANLTSAFGHQGGGVDHIDDRRQREDRQFSSTKQENTSKEIDRYRDEVTRAFLLVLNLNSFHRNVEALTKITNSFNNNLSRKKRAHNACVLDGGEMIGPGTHVSIESLSTTLHVQANKIFKLDIQVDVSISLNQKFTVNSESLGISREMEWNSIDIKVSKYWFTLILYWKLEVKHGDKVRDVSWAQVAGSQLNSMTITVTDCIGWYYGVTRHKCSGHTTATTSFRPTAPTPQTITTKTGTTPPTESSERGRPSLSVAPIQIPSSGEEQEQDTDNPGIVSEQAVNPLYWLLVLPLVAVIAVAVALCCLRKRKNHERKAEMALASEDAIRQRVRHESINSLYGVVDRPVQRHVSINSMYESNDVQLNPVCGTGTWSPLSRDISEPTSQEENIYEN